MTSDRYFDDLSVGARFESAGLTITESAIIDFAAQGPTRSRTWAYRQAQTGWSKCSTRVARPSSATSRNW